MKLVTQCVISDKKNTALFRLFTWYCVLANNLYNACLFRIRQVFCGFKKEDRTLLEKIVFDEVAKAEKECRINGRPFKARRRLSYSVLDKILRCTKNPDYFAGLPMQSAQSVAKEAVTVFKAWLSALSTFKKCPSSFTGKPKMPHYLKKGSLHTFTFSNQDCVFYPVFKEDGTPDGVEVKFPLTRERLHLRQISHDAVLKEAKVIPWHKKFILSLTLEVEAPAAPLDLPNRAGLDLGTDNIAAIACTDGSSAVCKGGAVLSENRYFAMEKASAVSILTKGRDSRRYPLTSRLEQLSRHHDRFIHDQMHKISSWVIDFCLEHKAGLLVIGTNSGWKQKAGMGKVNNQNFVSIPHYKLKFMIMYKAALNGITVVEQEESYTSRADITAMDYMPVYGVDDKKASFSGKRTCRGLYRCHNGLVINADCNGAANILRKAFPDSWDGIKDFSFLSFPASVSFKGLNKRKKTA